MPTPIGDLKKEHMYTVTKVGETKPTTTGRFVKLHETIHPYGEGHKLPAAQIEFGGQGGVYSDGEYTFEEVKKGGRRRKTKKSKRRARKTRRRHK
jgi:hypothetical protein